MTYYTCLHRFKFYTSLIFYYESNIAVTVKVLHSRVSSVPRLLGDTGIQGYLGVTFSVSQYATVFKKGNGSSSVSANFPKFFWKPFLLNTSISRLFVFIWLYQNNAINHNFYDWRNFFAITFFHNIAAALWRNVLTKRKIFKEEDLIIKRMVV